MNNIFRLSWTNLYSFQFPFSTIFTIYYFRFRGSRLYIHLVLQNNFFKALKFFLIHKITLKTCYDKFIIYQPHEHSVHPSPPFLLGEWGGVWACYETFKKGWLDRTTIFRGGLLGKRGVTFFQGGCIFSIKNKLKSEIFNYKKSL